MAFIVKKKIRGKEYYYLNENKRVPSNAGGTKVKTKTLAYLGKTRKDAEEKAGEIIKKMAESKGIMEQRKEKISEVIDKNSVDNGIQKSVKITIDELAAFCKKKGFVFPSSEIYGGFSGFWDFGPLGAELFNNIKKEWWNYFVSWREDMVGIEASIISHPRTWKASGHVTNFSDIAVVCKKCKKSTKIDKSELGRKKCECGGDYENLGEFNLLFKTKVGALNAEDAYLRGETAQAMFMDFKLVQQTSRMQLPFGIAQIGRCFRNEIAPRDFLFRSREFNIGEFEFFINPDEKRCKLLGDKHLNVKIMILDAETQLNGKEELKEYTIKKMVNEKRADEWHAYWLAEQILWFRKFGLHEIKLREHTKNELSHYSSATFDIDYEYPFGSKEIAGNANRGQFDLTQHQNESKKGMEIFDEKYKKKIIPRVIEPTFGMERIFLAVLAKAYSYDSERKNVVLRLPFNLAPVKIAVFPIVNKPEFLKLAREIFISFSKEYKCVYDVSGSIGRRYARQDEIGTPFCITIDGDSVGKSYVTIRDRDSTGQVGVKIKELNGVIKEFFNGMAFYELGKKVNTRKKL